MDNWVTPRDTEEVIERSRHAYIES